MIGVSTVTRTPISCFGGKGSIQLSYGNMRPKFLTNTICWSSARKRRALAALAVECLKQRRQQIVEVGARRTDEGYRQLDIVSKRRRYLRLAAGIPKCTAILLQHGLMDATMRSAVDEETQQRRRLVGIVFGDDAHGLPSCGARSGDRTPSS